MWAAIWAFLVKLFGAALQIEAAPVAAQATETGAALEAASQAQSGEKAAQAMAQAAVDAPKDVAGVAKELDSGTF